MLKLRLSIPLIALTVLACNSGVEEPKGALGKNPDFPTLSVCELLPGDTLATVLGGRLDDARAVASGPETARSCRYTILPADSAIHTPSVFVVHLQSAVNFDTLRTLQADPISPVVGLGDEAYRTYHPNTARYDFYIVKRERYMLEVTGDDTTSMRRIVELALSIL